MTMIKFPYQRRLARIMEILNRHSAPAAMLSILVGVLIWIISKAAF